MLLNYESQSKLLSMMQIFRLPPDALTYASKGVDLGTIFPGLAGSAYAYASTRFESVFLA